MLMPVFALVMILLPMLLLKPPALSGMELPAGYEEFLYQGQVRIRYQQHWQGHPQTLVFIHGFGANSLYWLPLTDQLRHRYNTVALDLKGSGYSDKPRDGRYRLSDQAAIVAAFLEVRDLRRVVLVGHSLGGAVALLTALQQNQGRIIGLILVDSAAQGQPLPDFVRVLRLPVVGLLLPALLPDRLIMRHVLTQVFADPRRVTPELIDLCLPFLKMPGAWEALRETAKQIYWEDLDAVRDALARFTLPALILWGEQDRLFSVDSARQLQKVIPGAELVIIPNAGHNPHEEQPAATLAAMTSFLQRRLSAGLR